MLGCFPTPINLTLCPISSSNGKFIRGQILNLIIGRKILIKSILGKLSNQFDSVNLPRIFSLWGQSNLTKKKKIIRLSSPQICEKEREAFCVEKKSQ